MLRDLGLQLFLSQSGIGIFGFTDLIDVGLEVFFGVGPGLGFLLLGQPVEPELLSLGAESQIALVGVDDGVLRVSDHFRIGHVVAVVELGVKLSHLIHLLIDAADDRALGHGPVTQADDFSRGVHGGILLDQGAAGQKQGQDHQKTQQRFLFHGKPLQSCKMFGTQRIL